MDLGTIKSQIDSGLYNAKDDLMADIQLVWKNAKRFNHIGHAVYEAADFLEKFAHERLGKSKALNFYSIIVSFIHSFIKNSYDLECLFKKNMKKSMTV